MFIDDFKIKIKKYDREKQVVIVNISYRDLLEIRGCRARYGRTKYSPNASVWIVSPPALKIGKNYFWVVEIKDNELWQQLTEKIIKAVKAYTSTYI